MEVKKEGDQVETCPNPLRGAQSWGWSTQRHWGTMGNTKTGLDGANGVYLSRCRLVVSV